MHKLRIFIPIILLSTTVLGQGSYIPLGSYSIHVLDRMEIKQGRLATPAEFTTSTKSYKRSSIASYVDSFNISSAKLSGQDYFNLAYLQNDNFEYSSSENTLSKKSVWRTGMYKHKAAVYDAVIPDFKLVVNPIAYQKFEYDNAQGELLYLNNRGFEMRGQIGENLSFYTQFCDEIQKLNSWNQSFYDKYEVIPGQSFLKTSDSRTFNYWLASGYVSYQAGKYFDIQLGQGRNFFGNGYRSLTMSDFAHDVLFLRVNTRIWKVHYSNIWGQLIDYQPPTQSLYPRRHYFATTHASINLTKKFNLGLFQTISFQRDSGYANGGFDMQYANPIIFYKPIENGLNSPDKAILGLDWKYNFLAHFSLYGQVAISELVFDELLGKRDWWGNKTAFQAGVKYIDVLGIRNLDLQLEYNRVRPYMYTSYNRLNAYANYNQNMAHPLGANFKESIAIIRYQPTNKLFITSKMMMTTYGNDTNGSNWGSDIRLSYYSRVREYGNVIGQGVTTTLYVGEILVSYMFRHNMFIDLQVAYRKTTSALPVFESQTFNGSIAFRWNINPRWCDF
ncbi:MAG: hypothetical protein V4590_12215 [Bacteroidota bacterium]